MRDIKGLIHETSLLDPEEGIRFRNYTIPQCQELLPRALPDGEQPLPEGLFWLLLTGEIPTQQQAEFISQDWLQRATENPIPPQICKIIREFPPEMHPMTQFSIAIMLLQPRSKFAKAYHSATTPLGKEQYWEWIFEDVNDIIAVLPSIAGLIYRTRTGKAELPIPEGITDWAGRFSYQLGMQNESFKELLRLYLTIHSDHEGGNVSAHAAHLVGSSLSDPYLAFSACINGLAGPLHGLANQEVLLWLSELQQAKGTRPSDEEIADFIRATLDARKIVPGYGHAVLRKVDPRFTCQAEFAKKHIQGASASVNLVHQVARVAPVVLAASKKAIANPYPNVDAHSGVLLKHYGLVEEDFYTVLFGVSRALGALSGLLWDRILGFPIERPKSLTTNWIERVIGGAEEGKEE